MNPVDHIVHPQLAMVGVFYQSEFTVIIITLTHLLQVRNVYLLIVLQL